jgi:superfamily I DNA/RNA helicase
VLARQHLSLVQAKIASLPVVAHHHVWLKQYLLIALFNPQALSPDDDPSFERVLNVPARRLGPKLLQQLREEQEQLLAAGRDSLLEQEQLQQQQQDGVQQQQHSLYRIAWRLLRNGNIATLHARKLQDFLETLQVC